MTGENLFRHPKPNSVDLVSPKPDEQGMVSMVVLDRIEADLPEYCTHGKVTCYFCDEWCWLGHNTFEAVKSSQVVGVCLQCATEKLPGDAKPIGNLRDHRRADGPH